VFFTIDAGPQVKAVCEPSAAGAVEAALAATPGVLRTLRTPLGEGARLVDST
jgi:diphosphomevalonate decarboxylase